MKKFIFCLCALFSAALCAYAQPGAQLPDNILNPTPPCAGAPPGTAFTIKELTKSSNNANDNVSPIATPLVGDIDGDGITEIVVLGGGPNYIHYTQNTLQIFEVKNNKIEKQQQIITPHMCDVYAAPISFAKVDGGPYAALFVTTGDVNNTAATDKRQLIKYTYNGTQYVENKRVSYSSIAGKGIGIPMIADFNGDGTAEVLVYDRIYNARTLTLLADGNMQNDPTKGFGTGAYPQDRIIPHAFGTYYAVADMDGDGKPEVVGGNCVYKVNITNTGGTAGNSFTLWSRCDKTDANGTVHNEVADGGTAVADFDGDGMLDVVVTVSAQRNGESANGAFYIWNPRTKKVIHTNKITNLSNAALPTVGPSVPFAGDIDNDGQPEICFTSYCRIYAYKYNSATKQLIKKWEKTTSDNSACTTMSMFDFNQDGAAELVYRDETHLRIINGNTGDNMAAFSCRSGTGNEYPVVADVNNDGSAEIIVTGKQNGNPSHAYGNVYVYASDPAGIWAPARKVWNQFAYNAVNINEDLTIPSVMFNPARTFTGGSCGTTRPFNAYLQQQTTLDEHGCPVFLMPDASPGNLSYTYNAATKLLTVTVDVSNGGAAAIGPPVHVTLYKNSVSNANKLQTGAIPGSVLVGETKQITLTKTLTAADLPVNDLIVRVNDNGTTYPVQQECNTGNGTANKAVTRHTITCNWGVGSGTNPPDYNELELPITLNNPTVPAGYTFTGWTGSNGTTPQTAVTIPAGTTGDLTYTANYSTNSYTITYNLDGGTVDPATPNPTNYDVNTPTITLNNPTKTGYTFLGWSGTGLTGSNNTSVSIPQGSTGNRTYTAHWSGPNNYTITYILDGGTVSIPNPTNYNVTTPTITLNNPTKTGYTFLGWSGTGLTGNTNTAVTIPTGSTGNRTYTANWSSPNSYNIAYNLDGGTVDPSTPNPTSYDVNTPTFTLNNPTKTGYTFTGWSGTGLLGPTSPVAIPQGSTGNRNYTANWSEDTYPISYNYAGGTPPSPPNKASYKITETPFNIGAAPTRGGWTFTGWTGTTHPTLSPGVIVPAGTTGALHYTAHWATVAYTLTYVLDGGTVPAPGNPAGYNVMTPQFTLINPVRPGYTFTGWTEIGGNVPTGMTAPTGMSVSLPRLTSGDTIYGNLTYQAGWTADPYTITYDYNGGNAPAAPNPGGYNMSQLALSPLVISQHPTRAGYTFEGWTGSNGTTPQQTVSITSTSPGVPGNLTYRANWTKNNYTITYNYDGGTAPAIPNPSGYDIDDLPLNIDKQPTKTGWIFAGWTGDNGAVPQTTVSLTTTNPPGMPKNLAFIANWTTQAYNITYKEAATGIPVVTVPPNPSTYDITTSTFTLYNPAAKDAKHPFVGWTGTEISGGKRLKVTVPQGSMNDREYLAHWAYSFRDRYGATDTLVRCEPPVKVESGYDGVSYEWIYPDGKLNTSPYIHAEKNGKYILKTNYGDTVVCDTIFVLIAFEKGVKISRNPSMPAKIGYPQQFSVNIPAELLPHASFTWSFEGGIPAGSANSNPTVRWNITGKRTVSVTVTIARGALTCTKTFDEEIQVYPKQRGFFVDQNVSGGALDGSSWTNAFKTIEDAFNHASQGDFVWVAQGEYTPPKGTAYRMKTDSIEIYGGFNATESYLYERKFGQHPTILKGSGTSVIENIDMPSGGARWDGFIVEGGKAAKGAGIYNYNASVTIANSIIRHNTASEEGGGVWSWLGNPVYINVEVSGNRAKQGAGMYHLNASPMLLNVTIAGNQGIESAGGMYNNGGTADIRNTIIYGNRAPEDASVKNEGYAIPAYSHSLIEGSGGSSAWNSGYGKDNGSNKDANPIFLRSGFDEDGTMKKGNYRLAAQSPAVDVARNAFVLSMKTRISIHLSTLSNAEPTPGIPYDLAGNTRIENSTVDMGAYEYGASTVFPDLTHPVIIPEITGAVTMPEKGIHYAKGHSNFKLLLTPRPGYNLKNIKIQTGDPFRDKDGAGMKYEHRPDGSVLITIIKVTAPITIETSGITVANETVEKDVRVWTYENRLYIETDKPANVNIYTIAGQLFKQMTLSPGKTDTALPPGTYVVDFNGHKLYKVFIK